MLVLSEDSSVAIEKLTINANEVFNLILIVFNLCSEDAFMLVLSIEATH